MSSKQPGKKQNKRKKVKLVIKKAEEESTSQERLEENFKNNEPEGAEVLDKRSIEKEINTNEKETSCLIQEYSNNAETKDENCHEGELNKNTPTEEKENRINDTKIDIEGTKQDDGKDVEDPKRTKANSNNPKITISEPINSPCKQEPEPKNRCPIYYGIKSYIHDFYQPPDKEIFKSGEYVQDDFQFLVEPGKRRWKNCWLRVALWLGVNLMLLGVIALLVGHLTSPRPTTLPLPLQSNVAMVDKWAVDFNNRLVICQLAGLAAFTSGAVVVMLALLVYSYQNQGYYVMAATVMPEAMLSSHRSGPYLSRIPLTGSVRGVQPTFVRTE